jgi:hypothetical protein
VNWGTHQPLLQRDERALRVSLFTHLPLTSLVSLTARYL